MISFIIPSIGRPTILNTITSLLNQTNNDWKCLIGFDGIKQEELNLELPKDDRISYFYIDKKLGQIHHKHNHAGKVRNYLMSKVETDWIGFVDDDDTLETKYIEWFNNEKSNNNFDCLLFKMKFADKPNIIPPYGCSSLIEGQVGISFVVNRNFIQNKIEFINYVSEDYVFLKEIEKHNGIIQFSNHIAYKVGF